jgi:delta24-sterol reductase
MANSYLMEEHRKDVAAVQKQVKAFYEAKKHFRIYHGSTGSTRMMNFEKNSIVDVSRMTRIFPVDAEKMTVQAEANVPMDKLLAHCLPTGFIPKVVMELKGLTTGGGFAGLSGESSSYKFGLFQNVCPEIEIILGDGSLRIANRTENKDLLCEAGGSLGTYGIITLLTIELIPAPSHVQIDLLPSRDPLSIPSTFIKATEDKSLDYIDGILYKRNLGVVMLGKLVQFANRDPSAVVLRKKDVHWFNDMKRAHPHPSS